MMIHLDSISLNEAAIAAITWKTTKNSWGKTIAPSIEIKFLVVQGSFADGEGIFSPSSLYLEETSLNAKLLRQHYQQF